MPSGIGSLATGLDADGFYAGGGKFRVHVSGESHYQEALDEICGGRCYDGVQREVRAALVLEDDNVADHSAVRIEIEGRTVGHLSRDDAPGYRDQLAKIGRPGLRLTCRALITGGWDRGDGDAGMFGVRLDLPQDWSNHARETTAAPSTKRKSPPPPAFLRVVCQGCGKGTRAPLSFAGRRIHCPGCGGELRFPKGRGA